MGSHEIRIVIEGENIKINHDGYTQNSGKNSEFFMDLKNHSIVNYENLVANLLDKHPENLAMANAIGAPTVEEFCVSGDGHIAVLRHHGLRNGMSIYDLGCGSGRTASALQRGGWQGNYKGHDIVGRLVDYLNRSCPGYHATVNFKTTILADSNSLDMVFHWSVFTHLFLEECYNYMDDSYRALKPGAKMIFSFLELEDPAHVEQVFSHRANSFKNDKKLDVLDTFLHRGQIESMARRIGYTDVAFTDGNDARNHPAFWQSLVSMTKPVS